MAAVPNVTLSRILQSRAEGPIVDSRETLEALRKLALRMMSDLEPVNDRSKYFDVRSFEDDIRALDIVSAPGCKKIAYLNSKYLFIDISRSPLYSHD